VLTSVLTGKAKVDRVTAGVAGAITGGAVVAYRGYEKGMREKISFAKFLAMTVTDSERRMQNIERREIEAEDKNSRLKESLLREKANLESMIQRSIGELESMKVEEDKCRSKSNKEGCQT
jgi:hypothetical protein